MFGIKGRRWLAVEPLPPDEHAVVASLRQFDFRLEELRLIDQDLGNVGLGSDAVHR